MPDPMQPSAPAPDAPAGGGGMLPGSPAGGPGGPGGSPVLSPGGGAGNKAAAVQSVKIAMPVLMKAMQAFEAGSKESQALLRALSSLNPLFGKAEGSNMVPAGLTQMAMATKPGSMSQAPPPGIAASNTPPPGMGIASASPGAPAMGEAA